MDQAFPSGPEPPAVRDCQPALLEERLPLFRAVEPNGRRHPALVPPAVDAPVQQIQPEALQAGAIHGLGDDQALPGHAQGLAQHRLGRGAVVERQEQERRAEGAVAEGKATAVVHDVGAGGARERAHVHRAGPPARRGAERGGDIPLAGSEIEDARAGQVWDHGGRLAPRVPAEERLQEAGHDLPPSDASSRRASGTSLTVQSAGLLGALSLSTASSSRGASALRPTLISVLASPTRIPAKWGSSSSPFLNISSALPTSPPKRPGTSYETLPASG